MQGIKNRALALLAVLAVAACSGSTGPQGPAGQDGAQGPAGAKGDTGANGQSGAPGISTGEVKGTLTYKPGSTAYPATNVTVSTIPDVGVTATSGADGIYELENLPVGVYTIVFSGNAFTKAQVANVSVVAGGHVGLDQTLVASNPLVVTTTAGAAVGFNQAVTMNVTATGGTAPYTYAWAAKSGPTAVTPTASADGTSASFTTGTVASVVAGCRVVGFGPSGTDYNTNAPGPGLAPAAGKCLVPSPALRPDGEFVGVTSIQVTQMTYNFVVTVTDAQGFSKQLTVAVPTATLAGANGNVPVNATAIAYFPGNTAATLQGPSGSAAKLNDAATEYPWFVPDVAGQYTVTSSASKKLTVTAALYNSASPTCGGCHEYLLPDKGANVAAKFKEWTNSAHKNHFFKYYTYDGNGALVTKDQGDAIWGINLANGTSQYGMLPTADPNVFWKAGDVTAPIPLIQFGLEGGEGNHYSSSCFPCHTTGYNPLAANNGFDDVAKAAGYSQGPLSFDLSGTNTATTGPQTKYWDAMPTQVKGFTAMQCESCHGPLGLHVTTGSMKPVSEYSVAVCAVCHDAPSHHDKVWLWRQSKHADTALAVEEGTSSGSCVRCHSAQGFAAWVALQQTGNPAPLSAAAVTALGVSAANVQPQTCQACHDPHTTTLRASGDTKLLPGGFTVNSAGSGALCMLCHNSRNGQHDDSVTTINNYSGSAATSIGAPHAAHQADIYAGVNAYFVTIAKPSGHMAVAETCVGCHLKLNPDGLQTAGTNHTFAINTTICKHCHGEEVNGEALQAQFDSKYAGMQTAIGNAFLATVPATFNIKGSAATVLVDVTNVKSVGISTSHGSPVFVLGFTNPIINPDGASPATVPSYTVALGNVLTATNVKVFDVLKGRMAKALWNYFQVVDGSKSIHNPGFVFGVIQATEDKLVAPLAGGEVW